MQKEQNMCKIDLFHQNNKLFFQIFSETFEEMNKILLFKVKVKGLGKTFVKYGV